MTGHAFQELADDDTIRCALAAVRAALVDGGRFAFETRNPRVRAWEGWPNRYTAEVTTPEGVVVRRELRVQTPVEGEIVRFTTTYTSPAWDRPRESHGRLRFLDAAAVAACLTAAGFEIEEQYGDWDRQPLTPTSPEIITIARKR